MIVSVTLLQSPLRCACSPHIVRLRCAGPEWPTRRRHRTDYATKYGVIVGALRPSEIISLHSSDNTTSHFPRPHTNQQLGGLGRPDHHHHHRRHPITTTTTATVAAVAAAPPPGSPLAWPCTPPRQPTNQLVARGRRCRRCRRRRGGCCWARWCGRQRPGPGPGPGRFRRSTRTPRLGASRGTCS